MSKEIVHFAGMTFHEIPFQDNPAFMTKEEWEAVGQDGCFMICDQSVGKTGRYIVLEIIPVVDPYTEDTVTKRGIFWELNYAMAFANILNELAA